MIVIDGTTFHVPILELEDSIEFLDKYAERMVNGLLRRELIGTFPKQTLRFAAPTTAAERAEFTALWSKLQEPVPFHTVTVPDADGVDFTFQAYFSNVRRTLRKQQNGKTYWMGATVNFTASGPKAVPA